MSLLADILVDALGEVYVKVIWKGIVLPLLQYTGIRVRMIFNFKGKSKANIVSCTSYNLFLGAAFWLIIFPISMFVMLSG
ncbi:MAG: hypothetical protein V4580_06610 [Bacteroidota bacterium]